MTDLSYEKGNVQSLSTAPTPPPLYSIPSKPRSCCFYYLFFFSTFLSVLILCFTLVLFPVLFQMIVNTQVVLKNGTLSFEQWLAPTPPIYKIVTVYNVSNPDAVEAGGMPELVALGPYYFREYRQRVRVEDVNETELSFGERKWYEFDHNATNGGNHTTLNPEIDVFTTFNIPYLGIAYNLTLANAGWLKILGIVEIAAKLKENTLFMKRTVKEVVFGFEDPLLKDLGIFMPGLPSTVQIVYNMSDRDVTTQSKVSTGRHNVSQLAQYTKWQGYTQLPYWGSDAANTVNGTEGLFFAPDLDKNAMLTTFVDDLFRSNPLKFVEEEVVQSLKTYKYRIPTYVQDNATNNPLNAGFYSYGPNGLMNLTAAVLAPIFASKPSFLDAEEWLIDEVSGLPPAEKETMDTNIWVEPHTGVLVKALKQLQVNIMVFKQSQFPGLKKLRSSPRYVPIAKIIETGGMDDTLLATFKNKVFKPRYFITAGLWFLFAVSALVAVVTLNCILSRKYRERRRARGRDEEEEEEDDYDDVKKHLLEKGQESLDNIYKSF